MKRVASGDKSAFEKLFNKYKRPIMSYIYQMIHDSSKAEELTQEVFFKVFQNASKYNPSPKFTTWLWTIAKYTTIDHIRKKKETLLDDMKNEEDDGSRVDQVSSNEAQIEDRIIDLTDKAIIEKCISKLPPHQKETIQLRIFSELPYSEIAEIVKKSEKAIKSLLNRAKESLKQCVAKYTKAGSYE